MLPQSKSGMVFCFCYYTYVRFAVIVLDCQLQNKGEIFSDACDTSVICFNIWTGTERVILLIVITLNNVKNAPAYKQMT